MSEPLPLSTLLSHALVAFTIELDNEFERQTMGLHRRRAGSHSPVGWLERAVRGQDRGADR